jgi:glyoxalase family protein
MLTQIQGLHHVTSMASSAQANNDFFTKVLGLRRIKKTVNFDAPDVYHLYYGDEIGTPGSVMTYFPFPATERGKRGSGEVGSTVFSVPDGSLNYWQQRFEDYQIQLLGRSMSFGEARLNFSGPDGEIFALTEVSNDDRKAWTGNGVPAPAAIRGFHSVSMRLGGYRTSSELLGFMGYECIEKTGNLQRFAMADGNGANYIDLEILPAARRAVQGGGSVHHIAFSVENRAAQLEARDALLDTGYQVTPVIDRDYFYAIYFRSPGGILFEIATNEPGFDHDEPRAELGQSLRLPAQHEHLRGELEKNLLPIID